MPSRATELRADLASVLGAPVRMTVTGSKAQLRAPAPDGSDLDLWQRVIAVLSAADRWGSTDANGTPQVWAEVEGT
ncbi:hypothetical protein [Streptomyces sp. NPDC002386]